jgi:DNA-binding response OmpR family regulator
MEFEMLQAFARHPDRVLSRDELLDIAQHRERDPFDRSVDLHMTRLRRKIEYDAEKPQAIKTIRGAGYIYTPRPSG